MKRGRRWHGNVLRHPFEVVQTLAPTFSLLRLRVRAGRADCRYSKTHLFTNLPFETSSVQKMMHKEENGYFFFEKKKKN